MNYFLFFYFFAGIMSSVLGELVYLEAATCESFTFSIFRKCEAAKRFLTNCRSCRVSSAWWRAPLRSPCLFFDLTTSSFGKIFFSWIIVLKESKRMWFGKIKNLLYKKSSSPRKEDSQELWNGNSCSLSVSQCFQGVDS